MVVLSGPAADACQFFLWHEKLFCVEVELYKKLLICPGAEGVAGTSTADGVMRSATR